jgi:hypothetical protein
MYRKIWETIEIKYSSRITEIMMLSSHRRHHRTRKKDVENKVKSTIFNNPGSSWR